MDVGVLPQIWLFAFLLRCAFSAIQRALQARRCGKEVEECCQCSNVSLGWRSSSYTAHRRVRPRVDTLGGGRRLTPGPYRRVRPLVDVLGGGRRLTRPIGGYARLSIC